MNKHLKIMAYALSALVRRKYRSLAIFIAYMVTVATLLSVLLLTHAMRKEMAYIMQGAPDLIIQRTMAGRQELVPTAWIETIRNVRGVSRVSPRYWGYYYDGLTEANYTVIGSGGVTAELELLEGRLPQADDECAVGAGVDEIRGVSRAEELILVDSRNTGVLYRLTGIFSTKSRLLTNDLVVLTDLAVTKFFGFPEGTATDLMVTVPNAHEVKTVTAKVKQLFPDSRPITKGELLRTYDMVFNWRSGMMLTVFSAALMAFCILAWDKATGISGEEKREIGILKAIGWSTSDVLTMKMWEGLIVSLIAFMTGAILAYAHIFFFNGSFLTAVIKGWSVLFPPFKLVPSVNLFHLVAVGFFTVVPYIASTIVPAWKTATTDPDTVMRG